MKRRLRQFITTYILFVLLFVIQKPLFMAYYHKIFEDASWTDYLSVIWHGLPLDLSLAGYLTVIPGLLILASVWIVPGVIRQIRRVYFLIISILMACIFVSDLGLFEYWGFRLDSTPLFYLFSSPKDAIASVSIWIVIAGLVAMIAYAALLYWIFYRTLVREKHPTKIPYHRIGMSLVLLLITGLLFIPIRGGFSVSTMNLSKAYFSANQKLNQAAINPCFSLMESLSRQNNFDKQFRYLSPGEASALFTTLQDKPANPADSIAPLFNTERPNIILVILESFSSHLMPSLGGENIAVQLDELGKEGILFTNFYANSFRTDRGLAAIISGYPGQPTTSIMKYPKKTQNLPSIPGSLKKAGYDLQYYYGGDADFTNMRSYLIQAGIENIISDKDFPLNQRLSKWGAHDHIVFNRLINDLTTANPKQPFFKILQTSSSHEPFEVPYQKLSDPRANAFAYADSCAGDFVRQLKETPLWKNTVIIFVPDHLGAYPKPMDDLSIQRYQIPLIMVGGAITEAKQISTYGSQIDIAATLLGQLNLPHDDFKFSKNIMNPVSPHFGYFTFPGAFGMVSKDNQVIFNYEADKVVIDSGEQQGKNLPLAKAFLQKLYDDLARR